ncbi:hypothetical protein TCON_0902 [Astathelohania contejeani]|uniref:Uncharacterized protein n=1 Tax=Astathelohania contejeani TaxID=164912 RepID=A0ABQ7I0G4_9MICR|nr:hypothetical protein TCON_0902 [Thelohania contejeani]
MLFHILILAQLISAAQNILAIVVPPYSFDCNTTPLFQLLLYVFYQLIIVILAISPLKRYQKISDSMLAGQSIFLFSLHIMAVPRIIPFIWFIAEILFVVTAIGVAIKPKLLGTALAIGGGYSLSYYLCALFRMGNMFVFYFQTAILIIGFMILGFLRSQIQSGLCRGFVLSLTLIQIMDLIIPGINMFYSIHGLSSISFLGILFFHILFILFFCAILGWVFFKERIESKLVKQEGSKE